MKKNYWIIEMGDDVDEEYVDGPFDFATAIDTCLKNTVFRSYMWRMPDRKNNWLCFNSSISSLFIVESSTRPNYIGLKF